MTISGNKIHLHSVLTVDLCTESFKPVFGEVTAIYVSSESDVYFFCDLFQTIDFNFHLFATMFKRKSEYKGCKIIKLADSYSKHAHCNE